MAGTDGISREMATLERAIGEYFLLHVDPTVRAVEGEWLAARKGEARASYGRSHVEALGGAIPGDAQLREVWERMSRDGRVAGDLALIADRWREAVVSRVGRQRYDEACRALGEGPDDDRADIASWYVGYRVESLILERFARDGAPRSGMEYVVRKAASGTAAASLGSLVDAARGREDATHRMVASGAEESYGASGLERGLGFAAGLGADALLFRMGSWSSVARWAGLDIVLGAASGALGGNGETAPRVVGRDPATGETLTPEAFLDRVLFGGENGIVENARRMALDGRDVDWDMMAGLGAGLSLKVPEGPFQAVGWEPSGPGPWRPPMDFGLPSGQASSLPAPGEAMEPDDRRKGGKRAMGAVGMDIVEGNGEAARAAMADEGHTGTVEDAMEPRRAGGGIPSGAASPPRDNAAQWRALLDRVGLGGIDGLLANLPYVVATLPEAVLGFFSGKSAPTWAGKDYVPLASMAIGMFTPNRALRSILIGCGGAGFLNRLRQDSLAGGDRDGPERESPRPAMYRRYGDERPDPRIGALERSLDGRKLYMEIDGKPYYVPMGERVVGALDSGAVTLGTVANRVLAAHDAGQGAARGKPLGFAGEPGERRGAGQGRGL